MKELDDYAAALDAVHAYFGFEGRWKILPPEDYRDQSWRVGTGFESGTVFWGATPEQAGFGEEEGDGPWREADYSAQILAAESSSGLDGGVMRGPAFTAVAIDTQCDGNQMLAIFDNAREVKP